MAKPARMPGYVISDCEPLMTLDGPWRLTCHPAGSDESFTIESEQLIEFTTHHDPRLNAFSGTVNYQTAFTIDKVTPLHLALGDTQDFACELFLNDQSLGVHWYGHPYFDATPALRPGENTLEIRYATTLWNRMKDTPYMDAFREKLGIKDAPTLRKTGLLGPVQLVQELTHKSHPTQCPSPIPPLPA